MMSFESTPATNSRVVPQGDITMTALSLSTLAYSSNAPHTSGTATCIGIYSKAINLLTEKGELLTLHEHPHGLSPAGWLLQEEVFHAVSHRITPQSRVCLSKGELRIGGLCLRRAGRRVSLNMWSGSHPLRAESLRQTLCHQMRETGLYGSLHHLATTPLCDKLGLIVDRFTLSLIGQKTDWTAHIGMGPVLTPSSDDMLVGMLAAAYGYTPTAKRLRQSPFFISATPLQELTTHVSSAYLHHACEGRFSTPLSRAALSLRHHRRDKTAVVRLLSHGHTSGADTLLGVWLGAMAVERLERV